MRKILFILFVAMAVTIIGFAEDKDSSKPQQVEVKISVDNKDSTKTSVPEKPTDACTACNTEKVRGIQWLLVFLPAVIFFILFYYFMSWLKSDKYKLSDALTGCDPITLTEQTKDVAGNFTGTTETEILPKSSSRLIAFLTGLTAMTIGICLTTYYVFITLADCPKPDLDGFWKVIASLGIGIIPYGANMWKESKKTGN